MTQYFLLRRQLEVTSAESVIFSLVTLCAEKVQRNAPPVRRGTGYNKPSAKV